MLYKKYGVRYEYRISSVGVITGFDSCFDL